MKKPKNIRLELNNGANFINIDLEPVDEGGWIADLTSNLKDGEQVTEDDSAYDAAIDGLESLVMALACEGVNIASNKFVAAIEVAIQSIANDFL